MSGAQASRLAALLGLLVFGAAGCHSDAGPPITPQHPAPLPPRGQFVSKPGKGGKVGLLPPSSMGGAAGGANSGGMSPQASGH
ncbi:MAG TPA: hypothetical protein VKT32_00725 [Chthonomonadaceae bacterium]|nr:hypothetical protein [Chthonomonadaceae bacterium]